MKNFPPATLALADGTTFRGLSFGAPVTVTGEVVFNTSLTGYQEILTDPSYCGELVTMTCPHIGNVGLNSEDVEANRPWLSGLIVREVSRRVSNWRSEIPLPDYLQQQNLPGLTEIDTRALVRHLRTQGAMMATVSADEKLSADDLVDLARNAPSMEGLDQVKNVTCAESYQWNQGIIPAWKTDNRQSKIENQQSKIGNRKYHVVAYDFGIKQNILRWLTEVGCRVTVVPATTSADEVLALNPDGVFLSNGPGDPAAVTYAIDTVRDLLQSDLPMFGICLGHQIMGLALGGTTHKLKFGHRGGNQPVQDQANRAVAITSHNHGFAVSAGSLPAEVEISHVNLNDDCIEGLRHKTKPIFSIQYHPEASPGPHDALGFFEQFATLMENG
ncbi:glutamine-hydrolyzing carbamoyl-phosphate synthase small subunit [Anaerolineales bacterium HSG25]|nr:glutamine-hydrolyzing carbamoyl-phosphate synthase small subunit [Anaerolineales bacterium HSG25]